ncbi:hypothetical protein [Actinomadura macrotermitis]|uniref:Uncharacterized protein n=1 Tax=Actinomadura macrotermitis TaxID=2585200 RepID=A0A7K0C1V5_9ACTN|nr:hypothetical protein [Actinomadura macrotermitis]MQY07409.1 hypothetical protein [Actinomadura macrotermitis]
MPGRQHDAINDLIRTHPDLALWALRTVAGADVVTSGRLRVHKGELNDRISTDRQADTLFVDGPFHSPHRLLISEVETRLTKAKLEQCARYGAILLVQYNKPVHVVMFTPDPRADRFSAPVTITRGDVSVALKPVIVGPAQLPVITEPAQVAADPALATLAVMAHGLEKDVGPAYLEGLDAIETEHAMRYFDYATNMSAVSVRTQLEQLMTTTDLPLRSEFAKRHIAQGKVEGEVICLFAVLEARGLTVSSAAKDRINTCDDPDQLRAWVQRAAVAETTDQIFD